MGTADRVSQLLLTFCEDGEIWVHKSTKQSVPLSTHTVEIGTLKEALVKFLGDFEKVQRTLNGEPLRIF
jgi:hypothetical protein